MNKIKEFLYKNWWVILGVIIGGFFIIKSTNIAPPPSELKTKENIVKAETITFGQWSPDGNKYIVGTIESESEVKIPAELNGKIKKIFVDMGDEVVAGQALASFDTQGDMTYINYKNSLNTLENAKNNADSSIASAKLNIINAEKEHQQLLLQLDQNKIATLEGLKNTIITASTTGLNILNYFDGQIGASDLYDDQFAIARHHIGGSNQILKIKVQNDIRSLRRFYELLENKDIPTEEKQLLYNANEYLDFLKQLKIIAQDYNILIQGSVVTNTFTNDLKQQIIAVTEGKNTQIDQTISQLNAQIQTTKNLDEQQKNQILASTNRIESVKANLELIKAQASGQIKSAQNLLNLSSSQKLDLIVRAPFDGKITEKFIRERQLVSIGTPLFTILNLNKEKKAVAFLSPNEITQLKKPIKIKYEDKIFEAFEFRQGLTIDEQTQKIRVDFILPNDVNILPGKTVKIVLSSFGETNLVPLSAISFEPNGTQEVLIVNNDNILKRKEVIIKNDIADGIKIISGINTGDTIIKYKNRFYNGQQVIPKK